jgi:hypothetical protein
LEIILFRTEEYHSLKEECQFLDQSEHPNAHRNAHSRTRIEYLITFSYDTSFENSHTFEYLKENLILCDVFRF